MLVSFSPFPVLSSVPRCLCSLTTFGPVVHTAHSGDCKERSVTWGKTGNRR